MPGTEGVRGGVYAGEIRLLGIPGVPGCEVLSGSDHPERYCADGRGRGAITGEAWEGSSLFEVILAAGAMRWISAVPSISMPCTKSVDSNRMNTSHKSNKRTAYFSKHLVNESPTSLGRLVSTRSMVRKMKSTPGKIFVPHESPFSKNPPPKSNNLVILHGY